MPDAAPRSDAAIPATRNPIAWILMQTAPRVEVLAISSSRSRIAAEILELQALDRDRGIDSGRRFALRGANVIHE